MDKKQADDIIMQLKQRSDLQALSPMHIWNDNLQAQIENLQRDRHNSAEIALMAALHLWNDNLNVSHSYAQRIEHDATGAYWHAIMHRMEQDYPNSKYWFRMAGDHPVKQTLPDAASQYLQQEDALDTLQANAITQGLQAFKNDAGFNSSDFVDMIQLQERGQGTDATRRILEKLQQIEFKSLFEYTYNAVFKS